MDLWACMRVTLLMLLLLLIHVWNFRLRHRGLGLSVISVSRSPSVNGKVHLSLLPPLWIFIGVSKQVNSFDKDQSHHVLRNIPAWVHPHCFEILKFSFICEKSPFHSPTSPTFMYSPLLLLRDAGVSSKMNAFSASDFGVSYLTESFRASLGSRIVRYQKSDNRLVLSLT